MAIKRACELEFAHCFVINFTCAKCKVTYFIKHFLISQIFYEGNTLINLGFHIRENLRYVVLIVDFTGLNVGIILIRVQKVSSIFYIYEESFDLVLEFSGTWSETA